VKAEEDHERALEQAEVQQAMAAEQPQTGGGNG
jgi:hypothetical protein